MKNYALFSVNGRFIGFTNFKPTNGLYKEMPDNFDPVLQVYAGDYETGGLKNVADLQPKDYREANIDQKWKVFESELSDETFKFITQKMGIPLYKQINAIMDVLYNNRDKIQLTESFNTVYEAIQTVRHNFNSSIATYEEAPKADVVKKGDEQLFFEEYTQKQLNILDEPVNIAVVEN
jgi:hypothetical protein